MQIQTQHYRNLDYILAPKICLSVPQYWGYRHTWPCWFFFMGARDLNSHTLALTKKKNALIPGTTFPPPSALWQLWLYLQPHLSSAALDLWATPSSLLYFDLKQPLAVAVQADHQLSILLPQLGAARVVCTPRLGIGCSMSFPTSTLQDASHGYSAVKMTKNDPSYQTSHGANSVPGQALHGTSDGLQGLRKLALWPFLNSPGGEQVSPQCTF